MPVNDQGDAYKLVYPFGWQEVSVTGQVRRISVEASQQPCNGRHNWTSSRVQRCHDHRPYHMLHARAQVVENDEPWHRRTWCTRTLSSRWRA